MTDKKQKKKPKEKGSGDKVPAEHGEQAEILASTSDEENPAPDLARGRNAKPEDAEKVKESIEEEKKKESRKNDR